MNETSFFLEFFAMGMEKELFQITEAARACGLSRSTLLRMEEKGLLTPAYIAPDSGRRYYDNHNVARIMQIEKFKSMGISNEQIINYFVRGGEAADMLAALTDRLHALQCSIEELPAAGAGKGRYVCAGYDAACCGRIKPRPRLWCYRSAGRSRYSTTANTAAWTRRG